ncbi:hypothetical protein Hypma_009035 [Hypsizygus marmoreus]|uniref:Endoplasmic reticulum-based factor for assembly of V-ATPase n=1 Tax=Hypsizygus marmoreus TaxID=39966 RepID=A0A369JWT6_HYPMA|nr:hypothetical protein Hypma_009035 [Hypsizygus marmoreus]
MGNANPPQDFNISLEPHLIDTLQTLLPIVPADLAKTLDPYVSPSPPATVPYTVLQSISQWARTSGLETLQSQSPPLDPQAYSMISLLAGTTTSPERKFGEYIPAKEPEEMEAERIRERKTITALLNALLSILGSGFAVWWAADKLGWRNEWRVLLAMFAAIVVAVAEAVLYLIWQSRHPSSTVKRVKTRRRVPSARHKKDDGPKQPDEIKTPVVGDMIDGGLRRRQ